MNTMTHADWIALLAPCVAALVGVAAAALGAVLTGLTAHAKAFLTARGNAAGVQAVAAANSVIQDALRTSASTIAGQIQQGKLDYSKRSDWQAVAQNEVALIQQRVPGMLAVAAPTGEALIASLMAKVDQQVVAAGLPSAAPSSPQPAS